MCSATELQQTAGKQTLQFCFYTVKGYCYATVSLLTDQQTVAERLCIKQVVLGLIPSGD